MTPITTEQTLLDTHLLGRRDDPAIEEMAEPTTCDAGGATVKAGDVVQIDPAHDDRFGGNFVVVTEPKPWGCQGYLLLDRDDIQPVRVIGSRRAYVRLPSRGMVRIGRAEWVPEGEGVPSAERELERRQLAGETVDG